MCVPFEAAPPNARRVNSTNSSDEFGLQFELESPRSQLKRIASAGDVKLKRPADILLAEDNTVNQIIFKYVTNNAGSRTKISTKINLDCKICIISKKPNLDLSYL